MNKFKVEEDCAGEDNKSRLFRRLNRVLDNEMIKVMLISEEKKSSVIEMLLKKRQWLRKRCPHLITSSRFPVIRKK